MGWIGPSQNVFSLRIFKYLNTAAQFVRRINMLLMTLRAMQDHVDRGLLENLFDQSDYFKS